MTPRTIRIVARTVARIVALAGVAGAVALASACAPPKPHTFGEYSSIAPVVTPQKGERLPQHLTVTLKQPANVAIFLVVPGRGSQLLFPGDSTQSPHLNAGANAVTTSIAKNALSDTSRLIRRPTQFPGNRGRGGIARDTIGSMGILGHGYLLVYATPDSLPYHTLATRVSGISIPIEDDDALATVTKLIRETTHSTGTWAAYATDFPP